MCSQSLENLATKARQWRQGRTRCHFPISLWREAANLVNKHSFQEIAKALQVSPYYLQRKMKNLSSRTSFAEVLIRPSVPISQISIDLLTKQGNPLTVRISASLEEASHFIKLLTEVLS